MCPCVSHYIFHLCLECQWGAWLDTGIGSSEKEAGLQISYYLSIVSQELAASMWKLQSQRGQREEGARGALRNTATFRQGRASPQERTQRRKRDSGRRTSRVLS